MLGGAGDLGDAVADTADQLAQADGHAVHGPLQLAEFVAAAGFQVLAQIARGHALDDLEGLLQRNHDLAGDGPGGNHAEQQGQDGGDAEHVFRVGRVAVTAAGLQLGQLVAESQQFVALLFHALERLGAGDLGVAEGADGGPVGLEGLARLLEVGLVLFRQFGRQAGEGAQGAVDGLQGRLFGIAFAAVGVAADLVAGLLQLLAEVDHAVELGDAVALQHGFLHLGDLGDGIVGVGPERAASALAILHGLDHIGEGPLVFREGRQLLVDQGDAFRGFHLLAGTLQAAFQLAQQVADHAGALFALAHFIVQAGDAQVLGQQVEAGDIAQLVAATDHRTQAGPTGEGDHDCQQQHQAEADAEFQIDAHITQVLG